MIPATEPYVASFGSVQLPVIAWSDEGDALVVDESDGTLCPAFVLAGFTGVHRPAAGGGDAA